MVFRWAPVALELAGIYTCTSICHLYVRSDIAIFSRDTTKKQHVEVMHAFPVCLLFFLFFPFCNPLCPDVYRKQGGLDV